MLLLRTSDNVLDALLMVGNCARAPELQQTRANPAVESAVKARIVFSSSRWNVCRLKWAANRTFQWSSVTEL
jgi:single-stranded DNA-binding protein